MGRKSLKRSGAILACGLLLGGSACAQEAGESLPPTSTNAPSPDTTATPDTAPDPDVYPTPGPELTPGAETMYLVRNSAAEALNTDVAARYRSFALLGYWFGCNGLQLDFSTATSETSEPYIEGEPGVPITARKIDVLTSIKNILIKESTKRNGYVAYEEWAPTFEEARQTAAEDRTFYCEPVEVISSDTNRTVEVPIASDLYA